MFSGVCLSVSVNKQRTTRRFSGESVCTTKAQCEAATAAAQNQKTEKSSAVAHAAVSENEARTERENQRRQLRRSRHGAADGQAGGLVESINRMCPIFKMHLPYSEADHVLNIAYNLFAGGTCLEHLELRRNDDAYLNLITSTSLCS